MLKEYVTMSLFILLVYEMSAYVKTPVPCHYQYRQEHRRMTDTREN